MEQLPPCDYIRLFHSCVTLLTLTRLLRGRGQRESALVFLPYPAAGVTALFTCFTAGYSLGSCFVNGNGVDLRGVSPNSRKVVLARRDSVVRSEVTRFRKIACVCVCTRTHKPGVFYCTNIIHHAFQNVNTA